MIKLCIWSASALLLIVHVTMAAHIQPQIIADDDLFDEIHDEPNNYLAPEEQDEIVDAEKSLIRERKSPRFDYVNNQMVNFPRY